MHSKTDVCKLCAKQEVVLRDTRITDEIETAFLATRNINSEDLEKFYTCATCAYKVQFACTVRQNYTKALRTKTPGKHCVLCRTQSDILLKTGYNPSNFKNCMKKFEKLPNSINYEKSWVCLRCLFGINIWVEMQSCIFIMLGISEQDDVKNNNSTGSSKIMILSPVEEKETKTTLRRTRNQTTPDSSSSEVQFVSETADKHARFTKLATSSRASPTLTRKGPILRKLNKRKNLNSKGTLYPKNQLKQLSLLKTLNNINFDNGIKHDQKMYLSIPFIKVQQSSQILEAKLKDINVISSDEEEELSKLSHIISSPRDYNVNRHLCNVCDKSFTTKCDYLAHRLKHKKVEELVINIKRLPVSTHEKLEKMRRKEYLLPDETINHLLTKYLGNSDDEQSECKKKGRNGLEESEFSPDDELYSSIKDTPNESSPSKYKRKHFQFKINLMPKRRKISKKKSTENNVDSSENTSNAEEEKDTDKRESTIEHTGGNVNQDEEEETTKEVTEDSHKQIEDISPENENIRRQSVDSDDITPTVSPLKVTENSETEDNETADVEAITKNEKLTGNSSKDDVTKNLFVENEESLVQAKEGGETEHTDDSDGSETFSDATIEISQNKKTSHPEEVTDGSKTFSDATIEISQNKKTSHPEEVIEDVLDEIGISTEDKRIEEAANEEPALTSTETSSRVDIEMLNTEGPLSQASNVQEQNSSKTSEGDEIEVDNQIATELQLKKVEENKITAKTSVLVGDDDSTNKMETTKSSEDNSEGNLINSDTEETIQESEAPQSQNTEESDLTQPKTILEIIDRLQEETTETEDDVVIVDEPLERTEEKTLPLTKLKKRRMTVASHVAEEITEEDDEVELLAETEKNQVDTESESAPNPSPPKEECMKTISLTDDEEITVDNDVSEDNVEKPNDQVTTKASDEAVDDTEEKKEVQEGDSDHSEETTASEKSAIKQVEMLGETVVWVNSDTESSEADGNATIAVDNDVEKEPNKASKNPPIMTNEDLLNILVEGDGCDDDKVVGKKRKRSNSESDTSASGSKKTCIEGGASPSSN